MTQSVKMNDRWISFAGSLSSLTIKVRQQTEQEAMSAFLDIAFSYSHLVDQGGLQTFGNMINFVIKAPDQ